MTSISYIDDFENWKESFTFSIPIKVRFSETDLYGHVNNTSVFIYFEEARIEFLKSLGFIDGEDRMNYGLVVADLQCDFIQQMYFDELLDVFVKVNHVGNSSLELHYLIMNETQETTVTGRGRVVLVDRNTKKSVAIPIDKRSILENV